MTIEQQLEALIAERKELEAKNVQLIAENAQLRGDVTAARGDIERLVREQSRLNSLLRYAEDDKKMLNADTIFYTTRAIRYEEAWHAAVKEITNLQSIMIREGIGW
jgi:hypothetical protein